MVKSPCGLWRISCRQLESVEHFPNESQWAKEKNTQSAPLGTHLVYENEVRVCVVMLW